MKISHKIVSGVSLLLVLNGFVTVISFMAIEDSNKGISKYQKLSSDAYTASQSQIALQRARVDSKNFLKRGADKDFESFNRNWSKLEDYLRKADAEIRQSEQAEKVDMVLARKDTYFDTINVLEGLLKERDEIIKTQLDVIGPQIRSKFSDIIESAKEEGEINAALRAGTANQHLLLGRLYAAKFLDSNAPEHLTVSLENFEEFDKEIGLLKTELKSMQGREHLAEVLADVELYTMKLERLGEITYERNEYISGTLDVMGPEMLSLLQDIKISIVSEQETVGPQVIAGLDSRHSLLSTIAVISLVAGVLVGSGLYLVTVRPVKRMLVGIDQMESGDLTRRFNMKSKNEIGSMSIALDNFQDSLQATLKEIIDNSRKLTIAAQGLRSNAETISEDSNSVSDNSLTVSAAGEQLSASINNISENTEEISGSISTLASSVEEITVTVNEVARNCEEESRVADKANRHAIDAKEIISDLGDSAKDISAVVEVISGIAEKTNLLALNATIEAASAGDSGKGFAVVANEVKELARQSAEATERISQQIQSIQDKVSTTVEAITVTSEVISEVSSISKNISKTTEEQATTVQGISKSLAQVSTSSNDISAQIRGASAGAQEVAQSMSGINSATDQMRSGASAASETASSFEDMANQVQSSLERFKV